MKQPVLVVDDDPHICELVKMYLEDEFEVDVEHNGGQVINRIKDTNPVIVILDVMLPGKNGLDLCKEIRGISSIPIIMLTAKGEETDKLLGLELGADDYITKPFSPKEVAARVKAVLRRTQSVDNNENIIRFPGIILDGSTYQVRINNEIAALTSKEFELLWLLASNAGRVFSRDKLLDAIWGFDFIGDTRAVDSSIKRIRKKLEAADGPDNFIHTVWGVGYKFEV